MGISTITAGRIYKGQSKGNTGEEELTYMEQLDDLALSKVNIQFKNICRYLLSYFLIN